jgi:hypothetical protein
MEINKPKSSIRKRIVRILLIIAGFAGFLIVWFMFISPTIKEKVCINSGGKVEIVDSCHRDFPNLCSDVSLGCWPEAMR